MNHHFLYAGLNGLKMLDEEFTFGENIYIRKTYAHLFAPFMMAFKPAEKNKHHEPPWKPAKGGVSFDIYAEIQIPINAGMDFTNKSEEKIWLLASLFRLSAYPHLSVPAVCDISFNEVVNSNKEPTIYPSEVQARIFGLPDGKIPLASLDNLEWVKNHWKKTSELFKTNPKFYLAYRAFDSATVQGKISSSLLSIWGAIEQLFSFNNNELKFRVSANLASFINERGEKRYQTFKDLSKLYNERSTAAHTSKELDYTPLLDSYLLLRIALLKIIETGKIPTQESLEKSLFT